ncbi:MAG: non-lysosomal glucosylceramidase [Anaerolineae bacterium]|nr:non-lysosomal glucosylceramidase [Anaerolineae bacterium]MDW8102043.1 non-lysosomal glucosylceramidase [Anaerolineae bacterium]
MRCKRYPFTAILLLVLAPLVFSCVHPATPPERVKIQETFTPQIPSAAWSRPIGEPYERAGRPKVNYPMIDDGPFQGLPLGGLGAGTIGRTYRGDFARWHLNAGKHFYESIPANQFSVFVRRGNYVQAHVLSPLKPTVLEEWNWDMPVGAGTYYALFPRAWFVYNWDVLPVKLVQKQFSPVIPHNYRESSYPVGIFEWAIYNPTDEPVTVGIMFSWQNLVGYFWGRGTMGGHYNYVEADDKVVGIVLTREGGEVTEEWDGSFAIATRKVPGVEVTYNARFPIADGGPLWTDFSSDGKLSNVEDRRPSEPLEMVAAALAVTVDLRPGELITVPFVLAWDFPIMEFGAGEKWYRRYTRFFGKSGRNALIIAREALENYHAWEKAIEDWQRPILEDRRRPEWYKTALFNELYYLVDGGTIWENGRVGGQEPEGIGRFAYLECFDYPFYNTFDVHFYASFALIQLWPELQKSLMRDFAAAIGMEDKEFVRIGATGKKAQRKVAGAVPHDLGSPDEAPWVRPNAYRWQDSNIWKDLNSKFVLQLWRDYVFTGDESLVKDLWPGVVQALDYLHRFDEDEDGLPDHAGIPDQTYDTWPMKGASAYSGSLLLAALEAAIEMGRIVGDEERVGFYSQWLELAKRSFEEKLWNGRYYKFDSEGPTSDSIMADQLVGQWYADATGLEPIVPPEHIELALRTIYRYNVAGFANGEMGAVNGMRPDGKVDRTGEQSQEVWTGTTYALAAFMLHRGLEEEAWKTAWGIYNVTYNRGYWFRTPEAWDITGNFRASMYMRPLSIWAIERALEARK